MRRIPWRRVLWITIVVVPIAAVLLIGWSKTRDLSRYQSRITEQVRKVTGRDLNAKVPLQLKISQEPALIAEGVTLSNASWGSRPEMVRVRRVIMYLDPASLFLGEAKVGRMVLEGADILVERNEAGDTNLEMLPPPDGSGPHAGENRSLKTKANPAFPWINTVEVRDSVLTITQGQGRPPVVLEIASGTLKSPAPNGPLQITGRFGAPKGAKFDIAGTTGSFDGWMRGLPGNIDLQGKFGEGKIAIKGGIGLKGTNLQINSEGPDISAFGPYIHLPVPSGGPYTVVAKALTLRSNFKVEVPTLTVGNSSMSGEALFRIDRNGVPTAAVNLDAERIDFAGLKAAPQPVSATPAQKRLLPAVPFSASWLGRANLTVTARVAEVQGLPSKLANGSVTLNASETRFTLRAAASIGAGSAGFDLVYDPSGRYGQATLTATASRVPLEDLSTLFGLDTGIKDGVADIDVRLRGAGRTSRDVLNVASGAVDFSIAKGTWPRDGVAGWPVETQRLLGGGEAGVPFNCIGGRFDVSGGIANLRRLVVDTQRGTMVGGGFVHLRSEAWEMIVLPEARDAAGAQNAVPFRLKGGSGRSPTGAAEPNLSRLVIGAGVVPSLVGTINQIARQPNVNACSVMAPRVEGLRPGLRAQLPTPGADLRAQPRRAAPAPAMPPRSGG